MQSPDKPLEDRGAPEPEALDVDGLVRKFQKELNAGLSALVLLSVLERADEDLYGYQIAKRLESMSDAGSPMKQGALYPVLRTWQATRDFVDTVAGARAERSPSSVK